MGGGIYHICGIAIDPHGFPSRNGDARTRRSLDYDAIRAVILDDVRLLNAGDHEVAGRTASRASAA